MIELLIFILQLYFIIGTIICASLVELLARDKMPDMVTMFKGIIEKRATNQFEYSTMAWLFTFGFAVSLIFNYPYFITKAVADQWKSKKS